MSTFRSSRVVRPVPSLCAPSVDGKITFENTRGPIGDSGHPTELTIDNVLHENISFDNADLDAVRAMGAKSIKVWFKLPDSLTHNAHFFVERSMYPLLRFTFGVLLLEIAVQFDSCVRDYYLSKGTNEAAAQALDDKEWFDYRLLCMERIPNTDNEWKLEYALTIGEDELEA